MKIISLQAENVKRLVAVEIKPDGNLVELTGKNGQGKTSVLDSIWWALAGADHIQVAPIRKGAKSARIRLDLGEIIVTRTFHRSLDTDGKDVGEYTSKLAVETQKGARFTSPQKMLDSFFGELSFDPLAFARMEPKDQFGALKRFVPAVNFEDIAKADKADRERRKEIGRLADQERAAALAIEVPEGTPAEETDEDAILTEMHEASKENTDLERRKTNRADATTKIANLRKLRESSTADVETYALVRMERCNERVDQWLAEIERLKGLIESEKEQARADINAQSDQIAVAALNAETEADELEQAIEKAGPLPEPKNLDEIRDRLRVARTTNADVRKLVDRNKHVSTAERLDGEYEQMTAQIQKRQADKLAAIAAAKIPVPGIEFGDGEVLLNGVPFEQASDAEQLTASVRIAMALNPQLRVIRIRDGSLLDIDAMKLLAEMADKHDMQVWIERVDGSGKVGFVLEDGHVRRAPAEQSDAAA